MIKNRKLFTETVRERIIAIFATGSGIAGGFVGGIVQGDIKGGVVNYAIMYSLIGGIIGIILALLVCGTSPAHKTRNFFERFLSNIISISGNTLFGATLGGFFGAFLNHPIFINIYSKDIYNSIIAINSNIGDGILIGGIAGAIGNTIGAVLDTIFAGMLDLFSRFFRAPKYRYIASAEKAPEKSESIPKTASQ